MARARWASPAILALSLTVTACGGASSSSLGTTTTSTTERPTLGALNTGCPECGEVAPNTVTVEGYQEGNDVFGGVTFSHVNWHNWGSARSTATAKGFFESPGESSEVTLTAFDVGTCGHTHGYQALEWTATFDPTSYFDTCTGRGVGAGWPTTATTLPLPPPTTVPPSTTTLPPPTTTTTAPVVTCSLAVLREETLSACQQTIGEACPVDALEAVGRESYGCTQFTP
jgi:hypothetical protein